MEKKSYPSLMSGKKIIYVHGFLSAGSTHTAVLLREYMPNATVIAPDLPVHPLEAMELLKELVKKEQPDIIIGTSMGGMYAEMLYGYDRILVNPAFQMGDTMSKNNMIGKQTFANKRQDGVQEIIVTKSLVKEYRDMTQQCFGQVDEKEQARVYGLFGDKDPMVHTFELFENYYPQAIHFHGEHQLLEKVVYHYLIPIIRQIDDKQESRERKTIFIDYTTLSDDYGKPKSSLHKAYEYLQEYYNIFFTVPAPTNNISFIDKKRAWIEDVFSAPAWNRVVFTNHIPLLYGDYLITTSKTDNFLGTTIAFGSDDFKTWEDIILFFERMGGQ